MGSRATSARVRGSRFSAVLVVEVRESRRQASCSRDRAGGVLRRCSWSSSPPAIGPFPVMVNWCRRDDDVRASTKQSEAGSRVIDALSSGRRWRRMCCCIVRRRGRSGAQAPWRLSAASESEADARRPWTASASGGHRSLRVGRSSSTAAAPPLLLLSLIAPASAPDSVQPAGSAQGSSLCALGSCRCGCVLRLQIEPVRLGVPCNGVWCGPIVGRNADR